MPFRLRTAKGKLKIEHSIIDGLRPLLETLLAQTPEIRSVIPGVIRPVRDAKGDQGKSARDCADAERLESDCVERRRAAGAFY
jgi:hypothetical protein